MTNLSESYRQLLHEFDQHFGVSEEIRSKDFPTIAELRLVLETGRPEYLSAFLTLHPEFGISERAADHHLESILGGIDRISTGHFDRPEFFDGISPGVVPKQADILSERSASPRTIIIVSGGEGMLTHRSQLLLAISTALQCRFAAAAPEIGMIAEIKEPFLRPFHDIAKVPSKYGAYRIKNQKGFQGARNRELKIGSHLKRQIPRRDLRARSRDHKDFR